MPLKTRGELTVPFIAPCYAYLHFYIYEITSAVENCKYKHYYFVFFLSAHKLRIKLKGYII